MFELIVFWFSGLPVKQPVFGKKVEKIEVEDRFAYLSDEDNSDDNKDDEDWSPSKEIQQRSTSSRQQAGEGKISLFWEFESLVVFTLWPFVLLCTKVLRANNSDHSEFSYLPYV